MFVFFLSSSFQQSVAQRDDLYVILHSLTIPDIGTMSCIHGSSSKPISQWIYLQRFYSISEALPFVQGEEPRKQASAVAYIKCSLETHQVQSRPGIRIGSHLFDQKFAVRSV
uniref:Uncharacterized protein n=1 Tax=Aegilops tauschii subsp. strangulata TaxID=200361 RepID=A0A453D6B9_AEGTS